MFNFGEQKVVKNWQLVCVSVGLWAGLIIGFVTEYYTSNAYSPVQDVADSCRTGVATNVIFGLALGYNFAVMHVVAVAALGMLSTIATGLAIDAYGPISNNVGGIAEMAGMSHIILERTDDLDVAGNKIAAIGNGFAIVGLLESCAGFNDIALKHGWRNTKILKAYSPGLGNLAASVNYLGGANDKKETITVVQEIMDAEIKAVGGCAKATSDFKWSSSDISTASVSASETVVGSHLQAAVTMKTTNGAFFYKCDAFNSWIKWKAGSESFVIVNASQELSYLETSAKYQAGDGNHFGGYWFDLAQAENNKKWHNLEELYLAPGTNLDLLLVAIQTASSLAISSRWLQVPFPKQTLLAADDGVEGVVLVPGSADTSARNNQVMVEEDTIASSVQYCCDGCSTVSILRRRWH
ncbi:hypothetical protein KIW84_050704 [Lathyrus oleraceus]|uniref:H(+)-exporting diphosphatase n=1 Tax=Pisum sativum TaxID=3888 RepID=A0A9D4WK67_PEA|nr:hypothetical protein KIW84_050704 [Pisum sativum]